MKSTYLMILAVAPALVAFSGCGGAPATESAANVDGAQFLLNEEPDGAVGVIAARESAEDGAPLVLVGRVGGSATPWIDGRAAFMLVDASMAVVNDSEEMVDGALCTEGCCADELKECTTLVKVVDAGGQVVPVDSRKLLGLKESDMVVVEGAAKKDKSGNFSMLATRVFIRK